MCERSTQKEQQEMFGMLQVVCSQCLLKAAGQILERRKAPPGAVSLPCVFTPKQDEMLEEVRKDGLCGFVPACVIW